MTASTTEQGVTASKIYTIEEARFNNESNHADDLFMEQCTTKGKKIVDMYQSQMNNLRNISYKKDKYTGRYEPTSLLLTTTSKEMKYHILSNSFISIDVVNSAPSMILSLCKMHGAPDKKVKFLKMYVNDRRAMFVPIVAALYKNVDSSIAYDSLKNHFLCMLLSVDGEYQCRHVSQQELLRKSAIASAFYNEARDIIKFLEQTPELSSITLPVLEEGKHPFYYRSGRFNYMAITNCNKLCLWYHQMENKVLEIMFQVLQQAFLIPKNKDGEFRAIISYDAIEFDACMWLSLPDSDKDAVLQLIKAKVDCALRLKIDLQVKRAEDDSYFYRMISNSDFVQKHQYYSI